MRQHKSMIIMRGLPGSGKSTLTSNIAENHYAKGAEYTVSIRSTDALFIDDNGVYRFNPHLLGHNHQLNQRLIEKDCGDEVSLVIVDNTNTTWKEIRPYIEIAKKYGYSVYIQEPIMPWAFDIDMCVSKNTHGVPKESIQRMKDRYEDAASIVKKLETFLSI